MNFPRPKPLPSNSLAAWSFAVAIFLVALGVRFAFTGMVETGIPYLTCVPAIVLATYFSGLSPGIAAAVASVLAAWFFFVAPGWTFDVGPGGAISLSFFAVVSAIDVFVVYIMRVALTELDSERRKSADLADQREVMFRELQHRVSNNLGVVSALLNLQRARVTDEKARQALTEAVTRLALVSKIHRRLHDPASSGLRLSDFIEELARDVLEASGASGVTCRITAIETKLASDKAVPFALIVAELISNALEHGFGDSGRGTILVDLAGSGDEMVLRVSDDGAGLPEGFSADASAGMGLTIVQSLAAQLDGRFEIARVDGRTVCCLTFKA